MAYIVTDKRYYMKILTKSVKKDLYLVRCLSCIIPTKKRYAITINKNESRKLDILERL